MERDGRTSPPSGRSWHGGGPGSRLWPSRSRSAGSFPALLESSRIPFALLGVGFAVLGLAFIIYGTARQRAVERAIDEGSFPSLDGWVVLCLGALLAILAVSTIVLVLTEL